ncbi:MAG: hypothetical protein K2H38_11485 [Muribaculaceae bacterium]|nr:hypothetical protein [Muribaculaceae bacterium]MDE6551630.1 hypothetical protein [Muribaculaceae bacterium]
MGENTITAIEKLRVAVERSVGRQMRTPRDFAFLRECIYARLRIYMSETTLKRLWEYIPGGEPRNTTLSQLASFLGYASWEEFLTSNTETDGIPTDKPSGYMLGRHISVLEDLEAGDRLRLVWAPDRVCVIRYLGEARFEVEKSEKTRLKSSDTFSCALILEGEPLYLDSLRQNGGEPVSYVCGFRSGIRFELLS